MKQTGTISAVENCGSIVLILLLTEQGWLTPVPFDQRPFAHLLHGEGCEPEELIGRAATYDGEVFSFED
jgi:hypothetical protein